MANYFHVLALIFSYVIIYYFAICFLISQNIDSLRGYNFRNFLFGEGRESWITVFARRFRIDP